jgi:hypothetical protein
MFCTKSNYKPIEEEPIEKEIRQPKLWIYTQKPAPPHKFAYSHRCIKCMSVMHTTLKCPHKK